MDEFKEKNWFIYLGDHHEGPFSLADIEEKMANGVVSTANYVWKEGMEDWRPMTEVPAFTQLVIAKNPPIELDQNSASPFPSPAEASQATEASPNQEPELSIAPTLEVRRSMTSHFQAGPEPTVQLNHPPNSEPMPPEEESPRRSSRGWRTLFFAVLLLGGGLVVAYLQGFLEPLLSHPTASAVIQSVSSQTEPLLLGLTEKYPALTRWISPLPSLSDISPSDYEELRNAAATSREKEGPKLALALSTENITAPSFYIASNLPDGAVIHLRLEGVAETLLNQISASATAQVVVQKRLGKSAQLQLANGQPLPKGQYEIYALEAEKQPPEIAQILAPIQPVGSKLPAWAPAQFKLLTTKSYFLGGSKDSTYAARLKEFHDELQKKASNELVEIQQFAATLSAELAATQSKFKVLSKGGKAHRGNKKSWDDFHKEWLHFQSQMNTSFAKWTPEALQKDYFYGQLYQMIHQAQESLENVHKLHHSYFEHTSTDLSTFEIQLGQATSVAESTIAGLKAKAEQAAKIPPTPNGMPRKDGL